MITSDLRSSGWMFALTIVLFTAHWTIPSYAQSGGNAAAVTRKSEPLYLHWITPWYAGDNTPPEHILTLRVTPSEDFVVVFSDPQLKTRQFKIEGRIDEQAGKYVGNVKASWKSGTDFGGEFKLDEPKEGAVWWFASAYWETRLVLSHQRSAEEAIIRIEDVSSWLIAMNDDLRSEKNAIRAKKKLEQYKSSANQRLRGKPIRWTLSTCRVDPTEVLLLAENINVVMHPVERDSLGQVSEALRLVIGIHVTEDFAAELNQEDPVVVSGIVKDVILDDGQLHIAITLKSVETPPPSEVE